MHQVGSNTLHGWEEDSLTAAVNTTEQTTGKKGHQTNPMPKKKDIKQTQLTAESDADAALEQCHRSTKDCRIYIHLSLKNVDQSETADTFCTPLTLPL